MVDDGQLTAPGWCHLYSECISDGWPSDSEKEGGDISSDGPDDVCADEDNEEDRGERESDDLDGYDSERVNAIARKRRRY